MSRADKRRELLERVGERMPEGERTDFNMDRWLDAYDEVGERGRGSCHVIITHNLSLIPTLGRTLTDARR